MIPHQFHIDFTAISHPCHKSDSTSNFNRFHIAIQRRCTKKLQTRKTKTIKDRQTNTKPKTRKHKQTNVIKIENRKGNEKHKRKNENIKTQKRKPRNIARLFPPFLPLVALPPPPLLPQFFKQEAKCYVYCVNPFNKVFQITAGM